MIMRRPTMTTPARRVATVVAAAMLLPPSYGAAALFTAPEGSAATRGGGSTPPRRSSTGGLRGGGGAGNSHHRSLVVGTPTGGGQYPFLVVIRWADNETDPRSPLGPYCHGTMIAPDVVLTSWSCRPGNEHVLVGDSANSSFVQFRNLTTSDVNHPFVSHPDGYHHLFPIKPVNFPGFFPATISRDPVVVGQEVTVVGYGANKVQKWPPAPDSLEDFSFPVEAYEARLTVTDDRGAHFGCAATGVGSCRGDLGAPVLDSSKSLVGIVNWWACGKDTEVDLRVDYAADWIERNACGLSARKEDIPYCPDLVCPTDARLLGYPWALLPNGTGSVEGIRGFDPIRVTQWPPPGTPLWRNTTTNVTITATDATGRTLNCQWIVLVAPLVQLGEVAIRIPRGSYSTSGLFTRVHDQALSGRVYKMSCHAADVIRGTGSSVNSRLRRPSSHLTGKPLTLLERQIKGSVGVPSVRLQFDLNALSDVQVHVNVTQNGRSNNVTYKVYGQVMDFLF